MRLRQYTHISNQLKGAEDVVEEFKKYQAIPQIKDLIDRFDSCVRLCVCVCVCVCVCACVHACVCVCVCVTT